jgi:predicted nucleic-acid-binding Zn-ribbon protein
MRKCEKCGASMKLDLRLKVNGGGYGIVVRVDEKQKATTIDDVRVAVCSECGCTEMYLEDLSKLKD